MNASPVTLEKITLDNPRATHQTDIAVIHINNPPVNALSQAVRAGLIHCLEQAEQDETVHAIIIHCHGRTFIAGADISEFGKAPVEPHLPDVLAKIDGCAKPVVAALFGSVLGGGFEVALSCHYRVAVENTKLGLPEVTLGLIPGAGGTQLLPRVAGVELALEMITSGKPKTAQALVPVKVIDLLVEDQAQLLTKTLEYTEMLLATGKGVRPNSHISIDGSQFSANTFDVWRAKLAKKARGQIAPQCCIDSIENAVKLPFAQGMKKEREMFLKCRTSSQSNAMRHAFFAERAASKVTLADNVTALPIKEVAIIGAGTMGGGIAMCFAKAGFSVKLLEMNEDNLTRGIQAIEQRFTQALKRGLMTEQQLSQCMANIQGTCDYQALANADLVVEAAFETMAVKKDIFSSLDKACKPSTILASNTSYLDIDEIAKATSRPEKVLGMHFFSPANIMKLLEVVRASATSDETLKTAMELGKSIGKITVAVGVCYGFVGNRMYACYGREANMLLLEGATPSQIDTAMQQWGMAMGPLAVNDMSGIDIAYKARRENANLPDDPLYFKAADVLVEAGRLGQKTNAGFYQYDGESKTKSEDNVANSLIADAAKQLGVTQRNRITDDEIQQRLIYALINEGANILDEGIANKASDIDAIWLNGYGFPRYYGGPMCYADEVGLDKVLATIKNFQQEFGDRYWQPAPLLERLVKEGKNLTR